ncbi:MAG: PTS lactose/cellobiose transporter subunit IIA [Kineothrix sp.]|nr:PTS lactose/cellobiose transporter subunit IIA [Kineothrix sp.]
MEVDNLETVAFQIISNVGSARSCYIGAIQAAREGRREEAQELMREGKGQFVEGHHIHMDLLTKSAEGGLDMGVWGMLIMHAEDQLMSAEAFGILAEEFMELYELMYKKEG